MPDDRLPSLTSGTDTSLIERVAELEAALADEIDECNAQAELVAVFANRWERERALADRLARVLERVRAASVTSLPEEVYVEMWSVLDDHEESRVSR
jgi:hypothetical protein